MGDSVTEGTVLEWLKQVGDHVARRRDLVEISTDKVDAEMPSPVAGTVAEILVEPDETVTVGTVLCRIAAGAGAAAAPRPAPAPALRAPRRARPQPAGPPATATRNATPVAARMAAAHGVDAERLRGSGPRGRVTKDDVVAAVDGNGASAAAARAAAPARGAEADVNPAARRHARPLHGREPLDPDGHQLPHARRSTSSTPRRTELKAAGKKLSFTHLIAWAIVEAADDMPVMANSFAEVDGKPQRVDPRAA